MLTRCWLQRADGGCLVSAPRPARAIDRLIAPHCSSIQEAINTVLLSGAVIDESLFAPFVQDQRPFELASALDLPLNNPALLRLALTHRSILHEWAAIDPERPLPHSNERLEFLGDAYLGMIVAEELFHRAPDAQEGELTSWRVSLVRAERLVSWAREIKLGSFLYLGSGERITEGARDRMLAGAFEALIGAIALDSGLDAAHRFVLRFVDRDLAEVMARREHANPKGQLQELLQERYRVGPTYRIVRLEGPDHARVFTAEARLFDRALGQGEGASKRDAEQAAAQNALTRIAADAGETLDYLSGLMGTHNDAGNARDAAGDPGRDEREEH